VTSRTLLLAALLGVLAAAVALITFIVLTKVLRTRREERVARHVAPYRADLLAVSAAEDPDGQHLQRLVAVDGPARLHLDQALTRLLAKVRGAPAEQLADVLRSHGAIDRAVVDLHHRSPVRRAQAVQLLGLSGAQEAMPQLVEALQDHAPEVRASAAHALGLLGDPDAAQPVLEAVAADRGVPAGPAADALEGMGVGISEPLLRALEGPSATARTVAAYLSGDGSFTRSTAALHTVLAHDPDLTVRETAAAALGHLGRGGEVEVLVRHTEPDHPTPLRRACATALGALGDPAAVPGLRALLADEDSRLAELAAHALVRLGRAGEQALEDAGPTPPVTTARTIAMLQQGRA
jgi:HEAT repeat protein